MEFQSIVLFLFLIPVISGDTNNHLSEDQLHELWSEHKNTHGLSFKANEESGRKHIFRENDVLIRSMNAQNLGFTLGHNRYSHMTHDEYMEILGSESSRLARYVIETTEERKFTKYTPKGVDWRTRGAVSPVKDQKHCGSCWAHAAVESAESAFFIKHNRTVILSPQNVMDCSWEYSNRGCNGGLANWAFKYMIDRGVNTENQYPYEAEDGPCRMKEDEKTEVFKLAGHDYVTPLDEGLLAKFVEERGPVAVSIDAGGPGFRFYKEGIYFSPNCSQTVLNHAVVVVGTGLKPQPHFILRNSWSAAWGDEGFFRFPMNGTNPCGVASDSILPIF